MGYVFDGLNRKIQLTIGTVLVDIDDMYSRWVDWLLTGDNSKYLLAMRCVGGDPISDNRNLGITFFLINGWRIVPQSIDHRLVLEGNLVTDPFGFSPVDTVPGCSIIVEYSVSNLVDSSLTQMDEINTMVDQISRILGLVQENFRVKNQVYDDTGNLTSAYVRLYASSMDAQADVNPIAEYQITAAFSGPMRCTSYLMERTA